MAKDTDLEKFINDALSGGPKKKRERKPETAKRYLWHNKTDWHLEEIGGGKT